MQATVKYYQVGALASFPSRQLNKGLSFPARHDVIDRLLFHENWQKNVDHPAILDGVCEWKQTGRHANRRCVALVHGNWNIVVNIRPIGSCDICNFLCLRSANIACILLVSSECITVSIDVLTGRFYGLPGKLVSPRKRLVMDSRLQYFAYHFR